MLDRNAIRKLLAPFDVSLSDERVDKLLEYLALLLRWNQKINLTSISAPEECVTRHFGESFFLAHAVRLHGMLLDIGSGAGFPGLALKLLFPDLEVVLLEPVAKRRAFLKEVTRTCGMGRVRIVGTRVEEFAEAEPRRLFDTVTVRAVGRLECVIPAALRLLKSKGFVCLWLGRNQVDEICSAHPGVGWLEPLTIPLSAERMILAGRVEAC